MLNYARQRVIDALKIPCRVVLATNGPAGLLASEFPCEAVGLHIYLVVPKTSDHLFNLENNAIVSLVSKGWELKGEACILSPNIPDLHLSLLARPDIECCKLVRVEPNQIQFRMEECWGNLETIDLT